MSNNKPFKDLIISAISSGHQIDIQMALISKEQAEKNGTINDLPSLHSFFQKWRSRDDVIARKIKASRQDPFFQVLMHVRHDNRKKDNSTGNTQKPI